MTYEKAIAESDLEAVRLLVGMIAGAPSYLMVPRPLLVWYHARLVLQLEQRASDGNMEEQMELASMIRDVAAALE